MADKNKIVKDVAESRQAVKADMAKKRSEDYAVVLDFLPHGYPFDARPSHIKAPVVQALGKEFFTILELVPKKDVTLQSQEDVYIGPEKREKIHHVVGKIPYSKLTQTAKSELEFAVKALVKKNEKRFAEFFNKAQPLTIRMHQLELLPGLGKRHTHDLLEARKDKEFESFEDLKKRIKLIPDPEKMVIGRILAELRGEEKYYIFVNK